MSYGLPPDLSRLGDDLASAAGRTLARRRRRLRLATSGIAGALIFAALTPAGLGPAQRPAAGAMAATGACDLQRAEKFAHMACEATVVLDRPYAIQ